MSVPTLPLLKALQDHLQEGTGKPWGIGRLPLDGQGQPVAGQYGVLTYLDREDSGAPLGDAGSWSEQLFQTSVVGARLDQAVWLQDRTRDVMVGQNGDASYRYPLIVQGLKILQRRLDTEVGPDPETGGIVSVTSRYVVVVTGA